LTTSDNRQIFTVYDATDVVASAERCIYDGVAYLDTNIYHNVVFILLISIEVAYKTFSGATQYRGREKV